MSLLSETKTIIETLGVPVETGKFRDPAPDRYVVLTPLTDMYELFTDNRPQQTVEEVRIVLFDKGNYRQIKKQIEDAILASDITITDRTYVTYDSETGYHQYAIDVAQNYSL